MKATMFYLKNKSLRTRKVVRVQTYNQKEIVNKLYSKQFNQAQSEIFILR